MPKRKGSDHNYEVLLKKLRKIENKIRQCDGQTTRARRSRRVRVLSSSSSSSRESPGQQVDTVNNEISPCHAESDLEPATTDQGTVADQGTMSPSNIPQENARLEPTVCSEDIIPENSEIELDDDILQILGVDPTQVIIYGKDIQKEVAVRFEHTATAGLSKDERKEINEKFLIPGNCKLIGAPALNLEIKAALSETIIKRDKAIEAKQNLLASAISGLGEAISLVLSSKEKNTDLLRILMNTGRAMCDCQHNDTIARRNFILYAVKKDMKESLINTKIDEFLFGQNLTDTLKAAKAINKSGAELKPPAPTPKPSTSKPNPSTSKNWKGSYAARKPPPKTTNTTAPAEGRQTRSQHASSSRPYNQRPSRNMTRSRR
ncbi:uncharacterized protein LOC113492557 [Trichoplusia ni]|uniref:Uncharacterized protein LOC113492557 n=1 Tax=Trichoplusia ni TaxID=7111 RepID=A0A7E5VC46_TRINI|nr:uncharacterized protein LOC113492557 [Trichoplusia ni]